MRSPADFVSKKITRANNHGGALAETVTTIAIMLPVLVIALLVIIEASRACTISNQMTQGAYLAARELAINYHNYPEVATTPALQQAIFSNVRINNYVSGNAQFQLAGAGFNVAGKPSTVTVSCTYLSGQGSPPLPSFPTCDPLKLGSLYKITSTATYALQ